MPLVVDLDDTLLRTDSLFEALFLFLRRHPLQAGKLPARLLGGRASLKRYLAHRALPDAAALPYRQELVAYLAAEKQRGRKIVLATGADQAMAARVAEELGVFDAVFASDGVNNLTGERKRARLVAEFGEKGFDYIGDSRRDDAVRQSARRALLADQGSKLARFSAYITALRPHHWLKNLLIFLPLITADLVGDRQLLLRASIAFIAFSLCASSVYLLNDLLDLPFDRAHPHKKTRPLAAGQIRLVHAVILGVLLAAAAACLAVLLSSGFAAVLAAYFMSMIAYSVRLKDVAVVDVLVLACGYAARVVAGALVVGLSPAPWLLALCITLFISLALVKRYTELFTMESIAGRDTHARGYRRGDRGLIAVQGTASGYLAVAVLAYHTTSIAAHRHWQSGALFALICLLLFYWINYMWLMAYRGQMHHDPLAFALSDRISQAVIAAALVAALFAV